jgi:hypothetical protein
MPEDNEAPDISKQLRLPRTDVRPSVEPRPGGLRAVAAAEARAAANPTVATEPVALPAPPEPVPLPADAVAVRAVMALGLYELLRALAMCSLFAVALGQGHLRLDDTVWDLYYIASNGSLVPTFMALIYTVVAVAVGAGLWTRQRWVHWPIVVFSFIAVVQYTAWAFLFSNVTAAMRQPDLTQIDLAKDITCVMIFVNLAIGLLMAFSPAVKAAFEQQTASEPKLKLPPIRPSGV